MSFLLLAAICAGLFAGASIYINLVEHPARLSCGTALAVTQFAPSYKRATVMQALLAVLGLAAGIGAWAMSRDGWVLVAALALGAVVPFTLLVILPTNRRLLGPTLDPASAEAGALLRRWGRLHAVRSALSAAAFLLFLWRLGGG